MGNLYLWKETWQKAKPGFCLWWGNMWLCAPQWGRAKGVAEVLWRKYTLSQEQMCHPPTSPCDGWCPHQCPNALANLRGVHIMNVRILFHSPIFGFSFFTTSCLFACKTRRNGLQSCPATIHLPWLVINLKQESWEQPATRKTKTQWHNAGKLQMSQESSFEHVPSNHGSVANRIQWLAHLSSLIVRAWWARNGWLHKHWHHHKVL